MYQDYNLDEIFSSESLKGLIGDNSEGDAFELVKYFQKIYSNCVLPVGYRCRWMRILSTCSSL